MTITKTNLQLINFINFARLFLGQHKENTKFRYALERMDKRLATNIENYGTAITDLQIEHAATESEGGPVLTDDKGNFRYTKDGLRARNKGQRELLAQTFDFEPYYATEVPENLNQVEKETCAGFVLKEEEAAPNAEEVSEP